MTAPFEPLAVRAPAAAHHEYAVGDSVWYHDERHWVEWVPGSWESSACVRISDTRIDPTPGRVPAETRNSFFVHADLLSKAPTSKNPYGRQPTKAAIDKRGEQRKSGARDNGDDISQLLRSADTLDEVYAIASRYLEVPISDLETKYAHLDNGRKRMCLGNLMRGKARKV